VGICWWGLRAPGGSGSARIVSAQATGGGIQLAHINSGGGALLAALATGGVATYTYTGAVGSESYTERARITSDGIFQVSSGATNAVKITTGASIGFTNTANTSSFDVGLLGGASDATGYVFNRANAGIIFGTNGAEKMRLDASGNLLWGITAQTDTPANGIVTQNPTGASQQLIGHATGSGSGTYYNAFLYNSSVIGSITQSGTTATLFNVTSDQRLKQNIQDADSASTLIDVLQVRQFDWKTDNTHQRYGFVAQELVTVAPEAVHQPADPEDMMAVDYSKLVPMLVKEIQDLRKRLAAAGI
jgi:Chaperone of endosialidase